MTHRSVVRSLIVVSALLFGATSSADTVVLKDGVEYKGAILHENAEMVTILSDGMEWSFSRDKIGTVTRDNESAQAERDRRAKRLARLEEERAEAARLTAQADAEERAAHPVPLVTPIERIARSKPTTSYAQRDSSQVILYSTAWCGFCKKARRYLTDRGVAFVDKNIEADPSANQEVQQKCAAAGVSSRGVPILDVYGTIVHGFDQPRIDALLQQHGS